MSVRLLERERDECMCDSVRVGEEREREKEKHNMKRHPLLFAKSKLSEIFLYVLELSAAELIFFLPCPAQKKFPNKDKKPFHSIWSSLSPAAGAAPAEMAALAAASFTSW